MLLQLVLKGIDIFSQEIGDGLAKKGTFSSSVKLKVSSKPLEIKGLKHLISFGTKIAATEYRKKSRIDCR
jgi:hypothetical protein